VSHLQVLEFTLLSTMHPIYRTGTTLLSRERFLYIYSTNIFKYLFRLYIQSSFIRAQNVVYFIMLTFLDIKYSDLPKWCAEI
jgi:hypothetical protein